MKIEIDLAKNVRGELEGTFSSPAEKIKGLPLTKVMVEGSSVDLSARDDQRLHGVLSADGQTISGDLIVGDQSVPFRLTRAGDPQIPPPRPGFLRSAGTSKGSGTASSKAAGRSCISS